MFPSILPLLLVQTQASFNLPPPLLWLLIGVGLTASEFLLARKLKPRYRWIALAMGVSALFVTLVLWRGSVAFNFDWHRMDYEGFETQVFYWMGVSLSLVIWIRPMFVRSGRAVKLDAAEAETLTDLVPGEIGRVLYEGSSWPARCEHYGGTIAPHQRVYVLRREGTTLIVAPDSFFHP